MLSLKVLRGDRIGEDSPQTEREVLSAGFRCDSMEDTMSHNRIKAFLTPTTPKNNKGLEECPEFEEWPFEVDCNGKLIEPTDADLRRTEVWIGRVLVGAQALRFRRVG